MTGNAALTSTGDGAGLYLTGTGSVGAAITSSTLETNTAGRNGGAVYANYPLVAVYVTAIKLNKAAAGAGIYGLSGFVTLLSDTIAGNTVGNVAGPGTFVNLAP